MSDGYKYSSCTLHLDTDIHRMYQQRVVTVVIVTFWFPSSVSFIRHHPGTPISTTDSFAPWYSLPVNVEDAIIRGFCTSLLCIAIMSLWISNL